MKIETLWIKSAEAIAREIDWPRTMGNVTRLLKVWNIPQKEFAKMIGVSASALSKYKTGEDIPSTDTCFRIAAVLGYTFERLAVFRPVEEMKEDKPKRKKKTEE